MYREAHQTGTGLHVYLNADTEVSAVDALRATLEAAGAELTVRRLVTG